MARFQMKNILKYIVQFTVFLNNFFQLIYFNLIRFNEL